MVHSLSHSGYKDRDYSEDGPENEVKSTTANPNKQLGFEISPTDEYWSFIPEFYPEDFSQMKKKELNRYASGGCGGESVEIKSIKNREFNATGVLLQGEINVFQGLLDHEGVVDLLSPITTGGGAECYIKQGEIGKQKGWDPHTQQWMFEYTIDLVSTGRDEHDTGDNAIVTAILNDSPSSSDGPRTPDFIEN